MSEYRVQSFRDLKVWQHAMDLAQSCYEATSDFPKNEIFGLTAQLRRAAVSIPANIAEGQGRHHTKEFINFLGIARGSVMELQTHVLLSERIGYLSAESSQHLIGQCVEVSRMISGLRRALEAKLQS